MVMTIADGLAQAGPQVRNQVLNRARGVFEQQLKAAGIHLDPLQRDLSAARLRAGNLRPFSRAWDAAMARVEDLERDLWRSQEASERSDAALPVSAGHGFP